MRFTSGLQTRQGLEIDQDQVDFRIVAQIAERDELLIAVVVWRGDWGVQLVQTFGSTPSDFSRTRQSS